MTGPRLNRVSSYLSEIRSRYEGPSVNRIGIISIIVGVVALSLVMALSSVYETIY